MNHSLRFVILLAACAFLAPAHNPVLAVNAVRGAELSYQALGGRKYLVTLKMYNFCSDQTVPTSYDVVEKSACGTKGHTLVLRSSRLISQTCPGACHYCKPGTCKNITLQEHVYTGTAVLLNNSCCERRIFIKFKMGRVTGTIDKDLYIDCMVNTCLARPNNSARFNLPPMVVLKPKKSHLVSFGAFDPDADTLAYALKASLEDSNKVFSYNTKWKLNAATGVCGLPYAKYWGWLKLQVSDIRDGQVVGYATREVEYYGIGTNAKNTIPWVTGIDSSTSFKADFCVGAQNCFTLYANDSNANDSVSLLCGDSIPGLQFLTSPYQKESAVVCWKPSPSDTINHTYHLTVRALDNACTQRAYSDAAYVLHLYHATLRPTYSIDSCGTVSFYPRLRVAAGDPKKIGIRWYGDDGLKSDKALTTKRYSASGKHTFYVEAYHKVTGCIMALDSGVVDLRHTVWVGLPADTTVCKNNPVRLAAHKARGFGSLSFKWSKGSSTADTLLTSFSQAESVTVVVTDQIGCAASATAQVSVFASPTFGPLADSLVCPLADTLYLQTTPTGGAWSGHLVTGAMYLPTPLQANSIQQVTYHYTDSHACTTAQPYQVQVYTLPQAHAGPDLATCQTRGQIALAATTRGLWLPAHGLIDSTLHTDSFAPGKYLFVYKNTSALGCTNTDTLAVTIYAGPTVSIAMADSACAGNSLILQAVPAGGQWLVNQLSHLGTSYFIEPKASGPLHLFYRYADSLGCRDSAAQTVQVLAAPGAAIVTSDTGLCINAKRLALRAGPLGGAWLGKGLLLDGTRSWFYPEKADTGRHLLLWAITGPNGCQGRDTLSIEVWPQPEAGFTYRAKNFQWPITMAFADGSTGRPTTWHWQFTAAPGDTSKRRNPNFTFAKDHGQRVALYVGNRHGCADTATQKLDFETVVGQSPFTQGHMAGYEIWQQAGSLYVGPKGQTATVHAQLFTVQGKWLAAAHATPNGTAQFDVSHLPKGIYLLRLHRDGVFETATVLIK